MGTFAFSKPLFNVFYHIAHNLVNCFADFFSLFLNQINKNEPLCLRFNFCFLINLKVF